MMYYVKPSKTLMEHGFATCQERSDYIKLVRAVLGGTFQTWEL